MSKLIKIVEDLNQELFENNPTICEKGLIGYSYRTDGYVEIIDFMGIEIYCSEYGIWNEKKEDYIEPTPEYIKEKTIELFNKVSKALGL